MNAGDVMTRDVVSVSPDTTVADLARLMLEKRISGVPVLDRSGMLVGMVSEGDCLRRVETGTERKRPRWLELLTGSEKLAQDYVRAHGRKVSDIMTPDPITVAENTSLEDVVHLMETRRVKRVPVMRGGKVVGIVSRANLLHALARAAQETAPARPGDTVIREQVLAAIDKLPWAARDFVNVIVRDGIVDLWGSCLAHRQDEAIIVAAENVPGVKGVRSHLSRVDPISGLVIFDPDQERGRRPAG